MQLELSESSMSVIAPIEFQTILLTRRITFDHGNDNIGRYPNQ